MGKKISDITPYQPIADKVQDAVKQRQKDAAKKSPTGR